MVITHVKNSKRRSGHHHILSHFSEDADVLFACLFVCFRCCCCCCCFGLSFVLLPLPF